MSATPNFASTPKKMICQISAANTNRDGTGATVELTPAFTASGGRLDRVRVRAAGVTTAGVVRIFESLDAGVTKRLLDEMLVQAATPSATVSIFKDEFVFPGGLQIVDQNHRLYMSTHNAEVFNCFGEGGAY